MNNNNFPNGFTSWYETHHEMVSLINANAEQLSDMSTGALWELGAYLTNKFEARYKDIADGEHADAIYSFFEDYLSNPTEILGSDLEVEPEYFLFGSTSVHVYECHGIDTLIEHIHMSYFDFQVYEHRGDGLELLDAADGWRAYVQITASEAQKLKKHNHELKRR